ncbi:MAG: septum formation protein Maf [Bdellovibrionales bacterium RBG_16_40_8]|nr:MAG: septum formation protein Maf [Bdellovibrionales bacterium RBG_16_40_8]
MYKLVLVSESPRRRQILSDAGFIFSVATSKLSETIEENMNHEREIMRIAKEKSISYLSEHNQLKGQEILLLSADTMVFLAGKAFGKPKNSAEAEQFLSVLSGRAHSVITGLCLYNLKTDQLVEAADQTEVEFRALSQNEIVQYVASGEPLDKAGAYAIQSEGKKFVKRVNGSVNNVIGFPLELFEKILYEKGWHVDRKKPAAN